MKTNYLINYTTGGRVHTISVMARDQREARRAAAPVVKSYKIIGIKKIEYIRENK